MTKVFVGLGSNLGDREASLRAAIEGIEGFPETELVQLSSFYDTEPVGGPGHPNYLNAVAMISTKVSPEQVLWNLQRVEGLLGRSRTRRAGPRPIDLDLLFYGQQVISSPGLEVPHPRSAERLFVLVPMVELDPEWTDPRTGLRMDQLLREREDQHAVRWAGRFLI